MEKRTFRSNSREVMKKIREHIQVFYNDLNDLKNDIEALKYDFVSTYQAAKRLVEGGTFLFYYSDVREFLESLNLNNKNNKTFSNNDCWQMYKHLLAREIEKIIKKGEF